MRAKHAANKLAGVDARAVMLEMAQHYEALAERARMIAAMLDESPKPGGQLSVTSGR